MSGEPDSSGGEAEFVAGRGRFFCRLCGREIRADFDLAMGFPAPPEHFTCPTCGGRALDEYTLLLNLDLLDDTRYLCPCGTAQSLWGRGSRFCFRCGRKSSDA